MQLIIVATIFIVFLLCLYLVRCRRMTIPFIYIFRANRWTLGVVNIESPLQISSKPENISSITVAKCQSFPPCVFMADPFIVTDNGSYYIFYEHAPSTINNPGADIYLLGSKDAKNWEQLGCVLREQFHTSYPYVFKSNNEWYMLPETGAVNQIRLYKARIFPTKWELYSVLINNIVAADATIFESENRFYILLQNNKDYSLRLYHSDKLAEGWSEHPSSPIRVNKNDTRPGGTAGKIDGEIIYFIQDASEGYGSGIKAYKIDIINKYEFKDQMIGNTCILSKIDAQWASNGMHTLSWVRCENNTYVCAVDGKHTEDKDKYKFSLLNLPKFRL